MGKFDRIYRLHGLLAGRRTPMALEDLLAGLECSKATFYRIVSAMRDYLGEHLAPFARRIEELLNHKRLTLGEARTRVRLLGMAARQFDRQNRSRDASRRARRRCR